MKTQNFIPTAELRCMDGVVGDLRNLGFQRWRMVARETERDSNERGHEVPQEVEGHSSYSAAAAVDNAQQISSTAFWELIIQSSGKVAMYSILFFSNILFISFNVK